MAGQSNASSSSTANVVGASRPSRPLVTVNLPKCGICGKTFLSPQALSGHKAIHTAVSNYGGRHQCSTCGRRFETGQALGGHMRKHFNSIIDWKIDPKFGANYFDGPSAVTSSSSDRAIVSYSGDVGCGFTGSPQNFDLNSLPSSPELDYVGSGFTGSPQNFDLNLLPSSSPELDYIGSGFTGSPQNFDLNSLPSSQS